MVIFQNGNQFDDIYNMLLMIRAAQETYWAKDFRNTSPANDVERQQWETDMFQLSVDVWQIR